MALTQIKSEAIADDAVTLAKQAAGTDGQIITYDASGNPAAVGPGTDGHVLTSTGAGSPPAFEALPASGATLSGSTDNTVVTVTGSNAMQGEANLTFDGSTLDVTGAAEFSGVIKADAGIDFSGAQTNQTGMTDETLDAYEEGTFTPILTKYTPGNMSGVSYSTQAGLYTKIGDIVHVQIRLAVSAGITWGTSSGAIKIADLPFAFGRVNMPVYKGSFHYTNSSTMYYPSDFMWLSSGSTITGVDSAWNSFTTEFDGSCGIFLIFSYTTTA